MKKTIERRLSVLEEKVTPPKRRIATLVDLVAWSAEKPRDENVEFAPWIAEMAKRVAARRKDEGRSST